MRLISDDPLGVVCVFMEAEGESYLGKVCVAETILRRTRKKFMSDGTVAGTVLRKWQFSGFNTDAANRIRAFKIDMDDPVVKDCVKAWNEAKGGSNYVPEVMHYLNEKLVLKTAGKLPHWVSGMTKVAEIGNHSFYK